MFMWVDIGKKSVGRQVIVTNVYVGSGQAQPTVLYVNMVGANLMFVNSIVKVCVTNV